MFARGPQAGFSPKDGCLAIHPGAFCRRVATAIGVGFVVYAKDGRALASEGSAQTAWREAMSAKD